MKKGLLRAAFAGVAGALAIYALSQSQNDSRADAAIEGAVNRICESADPLLVIDGFYARRPDFGTQSPPNVDINGDNLYDIGHGDLTEKIARNTGKETIAYGVSDVEGALTMDGISYALEDSLRLIKEGSMRKPAAVILAVENSMGITDFPFHDMGLTPENAAGKHEQIIRQHESVFGRNTIKGTIQKFADAGIAVVTVAGNGYSERRINMLGVFNTITVGALNYKGDARAPYSNDNSVTDIYRTGDVIVRRVSGGVDIDHDGNADFPEELLSDGPSPAERFNGQPLSRHEIAPADLTDALLAGMDGFIPTVDALHGIKGVNISRAERAAEYYGSYVHILSRQFFRVDAQGNLLFDPSNTGDRSQIALINGTSFAAPAICGK